MALDLGVRVRCAVRVCCERPQLRLGVASAGAGLAGLWLYDYDFLNFTISCPLRERDRDQYLHVARCSPHLHKARCPMRPII